MAHVTSHGRNHPLAQVGATLQLGYMNIPVDRIFSVIFIHCADNIAHCAFYKMYDLTA
jgi:hypothetical protein